MVSLVMYRDLPGGPKQIKFADEISRHSLCGKCRMFSMTMYRDPKGHVFCEDCLKAQSEEHGKDYIYCEYEKADVGIHEMYEDHDLVTMLRDQFVECPNKEKCMMDLNLQRLKTHYISCQPIVKCSSCGDDVQSTEWEAHKYSCARRNAAGATSKKASSVQQDARKPHPASPSSPDAPISKSGQNFQDKSTSVRDLPTREKFGEAIKSTPLVPQSQHIVSDKKDACLPNKTTRPGASHNESKEKCPHCGRTVKSSNFNVHLTRCPKLPVTCTYCQEDFEKTDIKIHEEGCKSNPQNQAKELQRSQPKRPRTPPPKVMDTESEEHESKDRRRGSSYADAVKGLIVGSSAPQSKEAQTGNQPQREDGNARQPSKEERKGGTKAPRTHPEESSKNVPRSYNAHSAYGAADVSGSCGRSQSCKEEKITCWTMLECFCCCCWG